MRVCPGFACFGKGIPILGAHTFLLLDGLYLLECVVNVFSPVNVFIPVSDAHASLVAGHASASYRFFSETFRSGAWAPYRRF